jgi:hypothetical protein
MVSLSPLRSNRQPPTGSTGLSQLVTHGRGVGAGAARVAVAVRAASKAAARDMATSLSGAV